MDVSRRSGAGLTRRAVALTLGALLLGAGLSTTSAQGLPAQPESTAPNTATTQQPARPQSGNSDSKLIRFITFVYSDLFGREPDQAGLNGWVSALADRVPRARVANAITYSTEYRARLITASYDRYLGRGPDPVGLATWLQAMEAGWTISQMEAGFIASPEYYARSGATDTGWVTTLYADVLGRTAGASEVAAWTGVLRSGGSRWGVSMGFLLSTEHLSTVVDGYYQHLLGRGLDPNGQRTWVGILQAGGRDEAIIAGIIASDEYWDRATRPAQLQLTDPVVVGDQLRGRADVRRRGVQHHGQLPGRLHAVRHVRRGRRPVGLCARDLLASRGR